MNERNNDSDISIDQEDYYLDNENHVMEFIEDSTDSEEEEVIDEVKADVESNTTKSEMYKQPSVTNRNGRTIRASIIFQIGDKNEDKKNTYAY